MVNARLHIICGNCGCNDMFEHQLVKEIDDDTNEEYFIIDIICNNCSTIHNLDNNSKFIKKMSNNKQSSVCKEFVPYTEALALKELGFDEHHYILCVDTPDGREYTKVGKYPILYQQAFRWFDENTELMGFVVPSIKDGHFDWLIRIGWDEELECEEAYSSRLEAELECLKKLIEIVQGGNK